MNKLKDLIYDKSDIIVALVIITIAGLIVFSRIDAILSYPDTFAAAKPTTTETAITVEEPQTTEGTITKGTVTEGAVTEGAVTETEEQTELLAVYINYGESLQTIANKFVAINLFSTSEEFLSAVETANAATEIKSGNFIIPSDATAEEVIAIITEPGL